MYDVKYDRDEWMAAMLAAEESDWCEIDAQEKRCPECDRPGANSPLTSWLCREAYDHDKVGRNEDVITAAFNALRDRGEFAFTPDRLLTVLQSCKGEVWDDQTVVLADGEILADPRSVSLAKYRFDSTMW